MSKKPSRSVALRRVRTVVREQAAGARGPLIAAALNEAKKQALDQSRFTTILAIVHDEVDRAFDYMKGISP